MKSRYKSIRTSAQAILAVAFLALGFNRAAAQLDPVSNYVANNTPSGSPEICPELPCEFSRDTN